jgi:hypothetical protein
VWTVSDLELVPILKDLLPTVANEIWLQRIWEAHQIGSVGGIGGRLGCESHNLSK